MIGLLTCLVLIVAAVLSAEAVRAGCRRRLLQPVAVGRPVTGAPPVAASAEPD